MINKRTSLLLLAVWATSRGEISYRDAVARATRLLGKSEPSKADRQAFSAGACNLKAHNLVTLEMHTTRVARIKAVRSYSVNQVWKRGLMRYIEREVDIPTREKGDPMRGAFLFTDTIAPDWAYSGPKYEHENLAVGLAENELNRLVNQKGLDRISELKTFGSWVYAFYHMEGLGIRG